MHLYPPARDARGNFYAPPPHLEHPKKARFLAFLVFPYMYLIVDRTVVVVVVVVYYLYYYLSAL